MLGNKKQLSNVVDGIVFGTFFFAHQEKTYPLFDNLLLVFVGLMPRSCKTFSKELPLKTRKGLTSFDRNTDETNNKSIAESKSVILLSPSRKKPLVKCQKFPSCCGYQGISQIYDHVLWE